MMPIRVTAVSAAAMRPNTVTGTTSPYPTIVNVATAP